MVVVVEGGGGGGGVEKEKNCCISHDFFKVASRNPNKIAVVHAFGGARICTELRQKFIDDDPGFNDEDRFFEFHSECSSPSGPATYKGDEFFTFSEILDSVKTLCFRIRCVLDGVGDDDPSSTIRPRGGNLHEKEAECNITSESSNAGEQQHDELPEMDTAPRVVGIYMVPSVEYIVSVLSVLRSGEAFLPLDPSWPEERILSIVSSAKVNLIIKCSSFIHTSDDRRSDWLADRSSCSVLYMSMKGNLKERFDQSDFVWPCESRRKRLFCYLMYTSGSTGKPKGVCGTEKGLLNRYLWMQELFPMHEKEILLFKTSISFIDHLQEFLTAILTCTSLVVPPFEVLKANPLCIVDFLKAYTISRLTVVPSVMRAILLATQNPFSMHIQRSLHVLVLSGEVLSISLWTMLCKLLPETTILNLYGSTEVSGDCTYFDCKMLPKILETEILSSVPIGLPMSNCDIVLVGEPNESNEAEIYVSGLCTSMGYFMDPDTTSLSYVKLPQDSGLCNGSPFLDTGTQVYFRTGDFARQLDSGDLVFLGRKDRIIKVNGQRIALEEIESVLREHPAVIDAAVISHKGQGISAYIGAYVVLKRKVEFCETLIFSIKSWLRGKLPPAMIPNHYLCLDSLPMSSTGKVDYASLTGSAFLVKQFQNRTDITHCDLGYLQVIKKAFCEVLMIDEVVDDTDFFVMGGDSIAAAQVAYKLGINMKLLYIFPSPSKLLNALQDGEPPYKGEFTNDGDSKVRLKKQKINMIDSFDLTTPLCNKNLLGSSMRISSGKKHDLPITSKYLKVESDLLDSNDITSRAPWIPNFYKPRTCSFSRCNKVVYEAQDGVNDLAQACCSVQTPTRKGSMYELWKVHLRSCVDASPLIVSKNCGVYLFIGSHSHLFLCVDALSGFPRWEVKLEGRIECSAANIDDFSQVVVGCYKGKIYFLDFVTGSICWAFQTGGEVKSQPVVDTLRKLVWCGSYDHNLYALDYKNHCCVYQVSCGGSIYGSPCLDVVHNMLYVASTSGYVTALSVEMASLPNDSRIPGGPISEQIITLRQKHRSTKVYMGHASPFSVEWKYELGRPVFGSLSTSSPHGNVICCLVDGHVIVLSPDGSIIWKAITGGPIFAGACISSSLPSQVLICSRNGIVYSFESETGDLLWEYNVGDPITSSAYVDEDLELISDPSHPSDRLVCICSSSGSIYLLRINLNAIEERNQLANNSPVVQEFAKMDLAGDIFSSPVMIGARIFVGCRDDYVHCIGVEVFDEKRVEP